MSGKLQNSCKHPPRRYLMRNVTEYGLKSNMFGRDFRTIHEYNDFLEENGYTGEQMKGIKVFNSLKCDGVPNGTTCVDSSGFHEYFDNDHKSIISSGVVPYDTGAVSHLLTTTERPNYNSKYITSDRPLPMVLSVSSRK